MPIYGNTVYIFGVRASLPLLASGSTDVNDTTLVTSGTTHQGANGFGVSGNDVLIDKAYTSLSSSVATKFCIKF